MHPIQLSAGDYVLELEPEQGGVVARFDWRGQPIFRPRCGAGPLNSACFPLVPFCNRIAFGRFEAQGRMVQLAPHAASRPHALHGFGWLRPWSLEAYDFGRVTLRHVQEAGAWPWPYLAEQTFELSSERLRIRISVRNLSDTPMPAGLGLHPYFPRTPAARYHGLHAAEWRTSDDGLPIDVEVNKQPIDWWAGQPIGRRVVDTVYEDRSGALSVSWPEWDLHLGISPSQNLRFTTVFAPKDAEFFCIEPVSHRTDAVNRFPRSGGLRWLAPNEELRAEVDFTAMLLSDQRREYEHCAYN